MEIKEAKFVMSNTDWRKCPKPSLPEYAFIGRSNVGKSSLINMLTQRKSLAKVSATPGKTQLINHFVMDDQWLLADLPGYGYAKVSKEKRVKFHNFTLDYLRNRENLMCTFVLIDSRLKPQAIDLEFFEFCGTKGIPFVIVFTKYDKLTIAEKEANITAYKEKLLESWNSLPPIFLSSSVKGTGREDILDFIEETNHLFKG
ncbi:MAG: YihA family ribosome biogenesis GTP-binding protein [Flavobacteriales bacterium]|nr:YihA family ribosome biogenesis GTP-binding protein [Flavobacteriales bacterium]